LYSAGLTQLRGHVREVPHALHSEHGPLILYAGNFHGYSLDKNMGYIPKQSLTCAGFVIIRTHATIVKVGTLSFA
jgi:hypothetical protein